MEPSELNSVCLNLINTWGQEDSSRYNIFKRIPPDLIAPLWWLKEAILTCKTNEDYVKVIIDIENFEKKESTIEYLKPLCKQLVIIIKENRNFTPKEKVHIDLHLLPSNSDSSVSDSSSSMSRQNSS